MSRHYYIDSVHGNDNNSGTTLLKPLKTWAKFQTIFRRWSTLTSVSGTGDAIEIVTIQLLNDLPPSDPICLGNLIGGAVGASRIDFIIQGQSSLEEKVA
jgi:hypothetical protein